MNTSNPKTTTTRGARCTPLPGPTQNCDPKPERPCPKWRTIAREVPGQNVSGIGNARENRRKLREDGFSSPQIWG